MLTQFHSAPRSGRANVAASLAVLLIATAMLLPVQAPAQTETVLYNFNYAISALSTIGCPPLPIPAAPANEKPYTGVVFYKNQIYGTTPEGGGGVSKSGDGTVFRLTKPKSGTPPWTENILHSFQPGAHTTPPTLDGLIPCSGLVEKDGVFYGTTVAGGIGGFGTIYALVPPATGETGWTENQLYSFLGESDGAHPYGGITMGPDGSIYGVNRGSVNGINGPTVYQFTPEGNLVTLLTNNEGILYNSNLMLDSTGALYGTTQTGPTPNHYGNIFKLTPGADGWTYDDLYDFTGFGDGDHPNRGLVGSGTDMFGTTQGGGNVNCEPGDIGSGCGVLFELRQLIAGNPYTLIVQHTFATPLATDGSTPEAGLYKDSKGVLWGTTSVGGAHGFGTVFELYPDRYKVDDWHYLQVYSFAGGTTDGATPEDPVTEDPSGNLYGTTNTGGSAGKGVVFQITP